MKTFMKLSRVAYVCAAVTGMDGTWAADSGGGESLDAGQASTEQMVASEFDQHKQAIRSNRPPITNAQVHIHGLQREKSPQEWYKEGVKLREEGHLIHAVEHFLHASGNANREFKVDALNMRAATLLQINTTRSRDKAYEAYRNVLKVDNCNTEANRGLMRLCFESGKETEDVESLNSALKHYENIGRRTKPDLDCKKSIEHLLTQLGGEQQRKLAEQAEQERRQREKEVLEQETLRTERERIQCEQASLGENQRRQAATQVELTRTDDVKFPSWLNEADKGAYQRFIAGELVYLKGRPDEKVMSIKDVANPETLAGTFDISGCGDAGQYVVFNTGFRTCQNPENANKVEVWFAPRFLVERELNGSAKHLAPIFDNWPSTNEVGIFWTSGGWNHGEQAGWYDYLISQDGTNLSSNNLYKKWVSSVRHGRLATSAHIHSRQLFTFLLRTICH